MDPALPPFHPKLPRLLDRLDLEPIDALKWNVILCCRRAEPDCPERLVLKFGSDERKAAGIAYEVKILRNVLPEINREGFDCLILPEHVEDGVFEGIQWVLTKNIEGEPLSCRWSELSSKPEILGGKAIGLEVAHASVNVLRDLRTVEIETLPDFVRRFRFDDWRATFSERGAELAGLGLLGAADAERASALFGALPSYRYDGNMFTNGDFYPRNFIMTDGGRKVAVVDWVGGIDPWSFVAMHAWLMMWGNPAWQAAYIGEMVSHFPIDPEEMQAGLLARSFDMLYRWRNDPADDVGEARARMGEYFRQCLEIDYVKGIFDVNR